MRHLLNTVVHACMCVMLFPWGEDDSGKCGSVDVDNGVMCLGNNILFSAVGMYVYVFFSCVSVQFRVVPILPDLMPKHGAMTVYIDVSCQLSGSWRISFHKQFDP